MQLFTLAILFEMGSYVTDGAMSTAYSMAGIGVYLLSGVVLSWIVYGHLQTKYPEVSPI